MTDYAEQMDRISHRQSYFRPRSGVSSSGSCLIDKKKQNGWGRSWIQIYMKTFFFFTHWYSEHVRYKKQTQYDDSIVGAICGIQLITLQVIEMNIHHLRGLNIWSRKRHHSALWVSSTHRVGLPHNYVSAHWSFLHLYQNHCRNLVHSDLQQMDIAACLG